MMRGGGACARHFSFRGHRGSTARHAQPGTLCLSGVPQLQILCPESAPVIPTFTHPWVPWRMIVSRSLRAQRARGSMWPARRLPRPAG